MSLDLASGSSQWAYTTSDVTADPVSIQVWVKLESIDAVVFPATVCDDGVEDDDYIRVEITAANYGKIEFNNPTQSSVKVTEGTVEMSADTWYHIVVASDSVDHTVYVNNNKETANNSKVSVSVDRVSIGALGDTTPSGFFDGKVAEVAVWDKILSDANVASLYASGSGTPADNVESGNLQGYWKLVDDGNDSAASNNLTLVNAPSYVSGDHPVTHAAGGLSIPNPLHRPLAGPIGGPI